MQEMELERQVKELANDQARCLYPPDGRDLPSELGKLRECVAEAKQLSWSTKEISNALVNLKVMPIQGIPSQLWFVKDVMAAFGLVLERLREKAPVGRLDA
jgi:hypothetical protein